MEHYQRLLISLSVVFIVYLLLFLTLSPFLSQQEIVSLGRGRKAILEDRNPLLQVFLVVIATLLGLVVYFLLHQQQPPRHEEKKLQRIDHKEIVYRVLKRALSEDEKKILEEVRKSKEITQDSLRFRLGWSKAKLSALLTGLDRRGIIQRERIGKTYKVRLERRFR